MNAINKTTLFFLLPLSIFLGTTAVNAAEFQLPNKMKEDLRIRYIKEILTEKGLEDKKIVFSLDSEIRHKEGFCVKKDNEGIAVRAGGPAGMLYGLQEYLTSGATGKLETPDFNVRGNVYFLYTRTCQDYISLTPEELPHFYDRKLMTKYLDHLLVNRFNAVFVWTTHLFNSIMVLPEYPEANENLTRDLIERNYEQFNWFTRECAKRNISVLLEFYSIILPPGVEKKAKDLGFKDIKAVPNDYTRKYMKYVLEKFMITFPSVGVYVCAGENLGSRYRVQWVRDVAFDAGKTVEAKTGRLPLIVLRQHFIPIGHLRELSKAYGNLYTEFKHNLETVLSPVPVPGHETLVSSTGIKQHIVNLHLPGNLTPFRWGSPAYIQEMVSEWGKVGITGAQIYNLTAHRFPYATDELEETRSVPPPHWPVGPTLLSFERDEQYLTAFGRYLWKTNRQKERESKYWIDFFARNFGNRRTGELILQWYTTVSPIMPALQNIAWGLSGAHPTAALGPAKSVATDVGRLASLDEMMARKHWVGPMDSVFFQRYKDKYKLPTLAQKRPVRIDDYLGFFLSGKKKIDKNAVIAPDKVADVCIDMAREALSIAQDAASSATLNQEEAKRYVTDSQALVYISQVYYYKIRAALEKGLFLQSKDIEHMEKTVELLAEAISIYEKLVDLTDKTYLAATDSRFPTVKWRTIGLKRLIKDLEEQKEFLRTHESNQ